MVRERVHRTFGVGVVVGEAAMDYDFATCNVVYVDRAAQEDSLVKRPEKPATLVDGLPDTFTNSLSHTLEGNLQLLLKTFSEGKHIFPAIA